MREIPKAVAKRIISNAGGKDVRVSEGASVRVAEYLEQHGTNLAKIAIEMTAHSGRKTVKGRDIEWAAEQFVTRVLDPKLQEKWQPILAEKR